MLLWQLVESGEMAAVWTVTHVPAVLDAFDEFIMVERGRNGSSAKVEVY